MVSNKVTVLIVGIIAVLLGITIGYLVSQSPEPMMLNVEFQHKLRHDATHYSVTQGSIIHRYDNVLVKFALIPNSRLFIWKHSMGYGCSEILRFKIEYYQQVPSSVLSHEYIVLSKEYVDMKVSVSDDGFVVWERF